MAKHNKKRNVGLLYEQLLRFACTRLVEKEDAVAEKAIDIICNNFKPGSALYQEFRLFNALVHTRVGSRDTAQKIIAESKQACTRHNASQLQKEKSVLIKEINHGLNDRNFYRQRMPGYRTFATVQALLNEWRGGSALGPEEVVRYEKVLEDWLVRDTVQETSIKKEHANPLTLNVMHRKFRSKYQSQMSREQVNLFESFLYGDEKKVIEEVKAIKAKAEKTIDRYFESCDNSVLNSKKTAVQKTVANLDEAADITSVSKALVTSALIKEMEGEDA